MRCVDCDRIKRRCLCAFKPTHSLESIPQDFRLLVIQSEQERDHYKNSSTFLGFFIRHYKKIVVNLPSHHTEPLIKAKQWQNLNSKLETAIGLDSSTTLLYPSTAQAQSLRLENFNQDTNQDPAEVTSYKETSPKTIDLILLDMTWGHSKRLIAHCPFLQQRPRLSLSPNQIISIEQQLNHMYETTHGLRYGQIRSGKRKKNEINSFESVLFTLIQQKVLNCDQVEAVWLQYQAWLRHLEDERQRNKSQTDKN